jgi:D-threo-aldose 1-dehydrogenase
VGMESIALAKDVTSSRVGFGCGGLMREPSARKRRRLLDEAFDQGIRHFDVARMYGLGAAEGELGDFARGRRESIVIATKFGIEAGPAAGHLARLQGPARRLLTRSPALRNYVKRRSGAFHRLHSYDVATARASLQASLRALRTDYVDILLLHDPTSSDDVDIPEIYGFLEDTCRIGQIRAWGVAGEREPCVQIKRQFPQATVLQVRDDIFSRTSPLSHELEPCITFGVLEKALAQIRAYLGSTSDCLKQWSEAVGVDCSSPEALASLLLRDALRTNPRGVVLFNTTKPNRLYALDELVMASNSDDDPAVTAFRRQVSRIPASAG